MIVLITVGRKSEGKSEKNGKEKQRKKEMNIYDKRKAFSLQQKVAILVAF